MISAMEIPMSKQRKAISPIIATVILVAVAVVIAAALSGLGNSIFASYSGNSVVTVEDIYVISDGTGGVILQNSGALADKLISIQVPPNDPIVSPFTHTCKGKCVGKGNGFGLGKQTSNSDVPPNGEVVIQWEKSTGNFAVGQQIDVLLRMQSGASLSEEVSVSDAS